MQTANRRADDGASPAAATTVSGPAAQVRVRIPAALREFTEGAAEITVEAATVADVLRAIGARSPALHQRLLSGDGSLRPFVRIFIEDREVRGLDGLQTRVGDAGVISIIPAVAGG